jgi:hypothetical protein
MPLHDSFVWSRTHCRVSTRSADAQSVPPIAALALQTDNRITAGRDAAQTTAANSDKSCNYSTIRLCRQELSSPGSLVNCRQYIRTVKGANDLQLLAPSCPSLPLTVMQLSQLLLCDWETRRIQQEMMACMWRTCGACPLESQCNVTSKEEARMVSAILACMYARFVG